MSARVERLRPGDGPRWRHIRLRALADAPHAFGTTHAEAARWSDSQREEQVAAFATFVAVVRNRDVGVARGASPPHSDLRELVSMWVDPPARHRRVGAQLIESVAEWAAHTGATTLVLDVVADNAAAIALYEGAGFRRFDGEGMG